MSKIFCFKFFLYGGVFGTHKRGCAKFAPFWMKKINIGTPHVIKSPFLLTHAECALKRLRMLSVRYKKRSTHAECALKKGLRMMSVRYKTTHTDHSPKNVYASWACAKKLSPHAERSLKNFFRMLSVHCSVQYKQRQFKACLKYWR
jgi:hypothetical protein